MDVYPRSGKDSQPFGFAPSLLFEGSDGQWSTFVVRVGTPAQTFRVMISNESHETWVPATEACTSSENPKCSDLRGIQPFQNEPSTGFKTNQSSTWEAVSFYELGLEDSINLSGSGQYGYETVGLGIQNSGGLTMNHSIVAGIATNNYMFGLLGLNPKPTNFTDFNDPQPSLLSLLHSQSMIPSLSYSYSAGAYYRRSLGALTLGGFDSEQFTVNKTLNLELESRVMMIGLQSIEASNTPTGAASLLDTAIMAPIDSTIPELWLPASACDKFEAAFGLQYDNATQRYILNDTVHTQLKQLNPTITIKIGKTVNGGASTNIVFPYAAFDHQISYPIYPNATNYFPIRRADNSTQYNIGRVFLQEAYFMVDYERNSFTITQRSFEDNKSTKIVPILSAGSPSESSNASPSENPAKDSIRLSRGAMVGIGVAVTLTVGILVAVTGFFCLRRISRQREERRTNEQSSVMRRGSTKDPKLEIAEIGAKEEVHEVHGQACAYEMDNGMVQELGGVEMRAELEGGYDVGASCEPSALRKPPVRYSWQD
ncbi:aspartic peptidase domain-containing protein [Amylocarpus encephaloides]|uniref:Aspartic peptidase domain-containing protein n=1 Tax=Amylocarpus encephaloides TaxID=45428 RepID=A0A9P7Y8H6_9HELO|nr:aspartic peptidase domain-containing protein [Amylocarpus encephaloides]